MAIPVYVFCGFLDSGKTTFAKNTISDPYFTENEKTLLIVTEDGEEEYEEEFLKEYNCELMMIDSVSEYKGGVLIKKAAEVCPDRVIIEYNGMWDMKLLEQELPHDWEIYQIMCSIDSKTYENYVRNMGPKLIEHVRCSELVVFNRCNQTLAKYIRSTGVNAMNPKAAIYLEDDEGGSENYRDGLPLPFDIDAPIIEIKDEDFGAWLMDAVSDPEKYDGKTVSFRGFISKQPQDPKDRFVAGRFSMVCCADDVSYLGFYCDMKGADDMNLDGTWAHITGDISIEFYNEFEGDAPVIRVTEYAQAEPPEEEIVYFR